LQASWSPLYIFLYVSTANYELPQHSQRDQTLYHFTSHSVGTELTTENVSFSSISWRGSLESETWNKTGMETEKG
jgi:hypothetical protein